MDLSDDAVVVRGGIMADLDRLRASANEAVRDDEVGVPALSVFCADRSHDEDHAAVVHRICASAPVPNNQIRVCSARSLREQGFLLVHHPPPDCHYEVLLGSIEDDVIEVFIESFDPPIPNPVRA